MTQTLLTVLALALAGLLGLQLVQADHQSHRSDSAVALRAGAARVAADRLEGLAALPFDEALKGPGPFVSPAEMTSYVAPPAPGAGFAPDAPADDLDDFDGDYSEVRVAVEADTVTFAVWTEVRYTEDDGTPSAGTSPTRTKRATVRAAPIGVLPALADTVRLSELVTCASPCLW